MTAWKQRVFPGAQIEPPDRWLMEDVAAALQAEAARARAEEREACAQIAARQWMESETCETTCGADIAAMIRARGAGGA